MKSNIIVAAMALCLVAAPAVEAMANTSVNETVLGSKKTKKKSSSKTSSTVSTLASVASAVSGVTQSSKTKKSSSKKSTASSILSSVLGGSSSSSSSDSNTGSSSSSTAGSILSSVLGGSSSSTTGSIISGLSSIFNSSMVATKDKIVGTWTYTEPAVVFSSENVLKNLGGKVASSTIEKQLQTQFEKYGIKKGKMKMTFDSDGNFSQTIGSKTVNGTYTIDGSDVKLKYAGSVSQIVGTTQLDGNDLLIVMDASKLLKYANTIGSLTGNSVLSTAGSLISSMDGMQVGLKLNK